MTGLGNYVFTNDLCDLSIEIKAVNHRFKDIRFKIPQMLSTLEPDLRKLLNEEFKRGSFEVFISYKTNKEQNLFDSLDHTKITNYVDSLSKLLNKKRSLSLTIDPCNFLRSEFSLPQEDQCHSLLQELVKENFKHALSSLKDSRCTEGKKLLVKIKEHKNNFFDEFKKIPPLTKLFQEHVKEKFKKKFSDLKQDIDLEDPRFYQEVVYYLEKLDIDEEINRIKAHLSKLDTILKDGGEIGRQIDFLVQELNRETNTIGSKSGIVEISNAVVQMKVQLEKIKEQGLNIE